MTHFILEKVGKVYKKGCVMLYVNVDLDEVHSKIKKADLVDDGIEDEPHVTLLYGLKKSVSIEDVKRKLKGIKFGRCVITNASLFENEDKDVLKFDVECSGLKKAYENLVKLPNDSKFSEYKPHMTIAYVEPGKGKEYVRKLERFEFDAKPTFVVYSAGGDSDKVIINID